MSNFLVDADGYLARHIFALSAPPGRTRMSTPFRVALFSTLLGAVIVVSLIVADNLATQGTIVNNAVFFLLMAGIALFSVGFAVAGTLLRFGNWLIMEFSTTDPPEDFAQSFIDWALSRYGLALTPDDVATLLGHRADGRTLQVGATVVIVGTPDGAPVESKFALVEVGADAGAAPDTDKELPLRS